MTGKVYTPDEVAAQLQITKQTVYELIKRRELAAFKVGNKMRIEETQLDAYKARQSTIPKEPDKQVTSEKSRSKRAESDELKQVLRLTGSHDLLLEKFVQLVYADPAEPLTVQASYVGSMEGAMALYRGGADIAAMHIFDPESQAYNLPFIRQFFPSEPVTLVHLAKRRQGLIVAKGNPKAIRGWRDLNRGDIRFVNRQKGSGTRQLLDDQLKHEGIRPEGITGYDREEWTHYAAASHLHHGSADVTVGIEPVAEMLGLSFVPLAEEAFELVLKWTDGNRPLLNRFLKRLEDPQLRVQLKEIPGYDLSELGTVRYSTDRDFR